MRVCSQQWLDRRCREAGKQNGECDGCIVQRGETLTVDETHPAFPHRPAGEYRSVQPQRSGPGAELSTILKDWLGIESSPTCSCRSMAAKMDAMGEEWCEGPGMPEILSVMRTEHGKRRLLIPWSDTAAAAMVRLACWRSRRKR